MTVEGEPTPRMRRPDNLTDIGFGLPASKELLLLLATSCADAAEAEALVSLAWPDGRQAAQAEAEAEADCSKAFAVGLY